MKKLPHQDYKDSVFKLEFEQDKVDSNGTIKLNSLQFTTNNNQFRNFVINGKVNVYLHLECSNTLYRKLIKLSAEPINYEIDKNELSGKLYITSFAVANEDIKDYYDNDFADDYEDTHFDIDKYDIMAFDDGYSIDIIHDVDKDDKISSIFVVVPKIDDKNDGVDYSYESDRIIIKLPQLTYNQYDRLKYLERYQNLFFSIFAIPVLTLALNELKKINFDDLDIQFKWFISVKNAYEKLFDQELSSEIFEELDCYVFAQKVFDNPLINTIDGLYNDGDIQREGQDDEED
jgi:hypothetical protein